MCIECRFSQPQAKTPLVLTDVEEKQRLTMKVFEPYLSGASGPQAATALGKLQLKRENIVLVVCACRQLQPELAEKVESLASQRVLVLDKRALKALYGPSLWSRPQFVMAGRPSSGGASAEGSPDFGGGQAGADGCAGPAPASSLPVSSAETQESGELPALSTGKPSGKPNSTGKGKGAKRGHSSGTGSSTPAEKKQKKDVTNVRNSSDLESGSRNAGVDYQAHKQQQKRKAAAN